ncbi:MAG: DNA-binding protein [Acidobacteriota bacterium]|nr:DNA-binding protein [Acidobacteriota bacterium]MDE3146816.1 DNA-binding protein [Acidobacteriota bacterium]
MRTLAIRLEDEEHAQLQMIARLEDLSLTDALRQAIDLWISERRNNPELQARAAAILEDIDRDAATRRTAIEVILGSTSPTKRTSASSRKGRGTARASEEPAE